MKICMFGHLAVIPTALLLNLFFNPVFAQPETNKIIKRYSIQDGLSQAVINSITQDDKGWMWFATDDGLNRFDGYSFTPFKFGGNGPNQFQDNFVQRIFKDRKEGCGYLLAEDYINSICQHNSGLYF